MKIRFAVDIQIVDDGSVDVENDNGQESTYDLTVTDFDLSMGWIEVEATRTEGFNMSGEMVAEAIIAAEALRVEVDDIEFEEVVR